MQLDKNQVYHNLSNLEIDIEMYDTVTSTNDLAKEKLVHNSNKPILIAAKKQTAGRGRRGKVFQSNLSSGLYFSLAFKPQIDSLEDIPLYTPYAVTILIQSLQEYVDDSFKIKWVNDIFYKNKKVSGILSEMTTSIEGNKIDGIVIGIGLNLAGSFDHFNPDFQKVAGSIFGDSIPSSFDPNAFLADFSATFFNLEHQIQSRNFLDLYESRLLGIGKNITYKQSNQFFQGVIKGIDKDAHLLVENEEGLKVLYGEEISFESSQFLDL